MTYQGKKTASAGFLHIQLKCPPKPDKEILNIRTG